MNVNRYVLTGSLMALAGALISFYIAHHQQKTAVQTAEETIGVTAVPGTGTSGLRRIHLYFSGPGQTSLVAESRDLPNSGDPAELGKGIVQALIDGPREKGVRTLPEQAVVRDVFITDDGMAYVNFSEAVAEDHPGGIQTEFISIYSVVNSLVLNMEEISAVKLLIGGREADTLAGHVDLRFPYKANILLVK